MTHRDQQRAADSPREEYAHRCAAQRSQANRYRRMARRLIITKRVYLASFIGYVVFDPTVAVVLLPVAISIIPLVIVQQWLVTRWARHRQAAMYYQRALDRLDDQWMGQGDEGLRYVQEDHPYCGDLDVFGRGSMFQLLCTAHTAAGRDALAGWLLAPADAPTVRARQLAARELRDQVELREAIDLSGASTPYVDMASVRALETAEPILANRLVRVAATLFAWSWLATLVLGLGRSGLSSDLCLLGLTIEATAYVLLRRRVGSITSRGYQAGIGLVAASVFAEAVKKQVGQCELLQTLAATISQPPRPLRKTTASVAGLLLQLPVAYFVAVQLFPVLETRLRRRVNSMPRFWEAIGHYEALCAFAAQAHEHPADCFPILAESGPCFLAQAIGHPLIPQSASVRNDVRLDQHLRLLMVSGSNMSGKSTLLRTVGVNAVLALAGAPVRAQALQISPLVIGSAMRFQDSLESGTSYFYSVLRRLRAVLDLLDRPAPLLFLLDEILQGTNSHDRLVGAEAVIRRLINEQAIGLVTTHDLELARGRSLGARRGQCAFL